MSSSRPTPPLVAVIGCGSIGERHVRTFLATRRARILGCDNRPAICEQMKARYGVDTVADWNAALRNPEVAAMVVATPAPSHVEMATRCLDAGKHVLIEKPLALSLDGIEGLRAALARSGRVAAVGYVLHFVPALQAARQFLQGGALGQVKQVAVNAGQHFPDFRPAYREIYYRDRSQGGGAIQDALTHLVNAVEWIVGPTTQAYCDAAHQVLEGVTVEDTVNVTARHGPVLASYALNQFQAPNETRFDFHAVGGSVRVEPTAQRWGVLAKGESNWRWHPAPVTDRDLIYTAQARAFLDAMDGHVTGLCTLEEGIQTLRFNLAALASWEKNAPVKP